MLKKKQKTRTIDEIIKRLPSEVRTKPIVGYIIIMIDAEGQPNILTNTNVAGVKDTFTPFN